MTTVKKIHHRLLRTERNKISLQKSQVAAHAKKKDPTTGIPPKLWGHLIPPMPVVTSTIYRHYAKGPPAKSWSLTFDLAIAIISDLLKRSSSKTVEDLQRLSTIKGTPVPSDMKRRKVIVPNDYRVRAGNHLGCLFNAQDEHVIGWDWKNDKKRAKELKGEWMTPKKAIKNDDHGTSNVGNNNNKSVLPLKNKRTIFYLHGGAYYLGSYGLYRNLSARLAKLSDAQVFAINYRLAPQHPFPVAVEDALAAYLYMVDPPEGIEPIDPESIVVAGDSAGGGLTFSLLLALRDAGLPLPGGAMTLSPWVDLTHSLESIVTNISTDYLPSTGFKHAPSEAQDYTLLPPLKNTSAHENIIESSFGNDMDRFQFYADNKALKHPLVSPVFDKKNLQGLPKLLIQTGTAERLHDEAIYAALLASDTCSSFTCNTKKQVRGDDGIKDHNDEQQQSLKPTNVRLEMYVDQPHVFQIILPTRASTTAIKRLANFVRDATPESPLVTKEGDDDNNNKKETTQQGIQIHTVSPRGDVTDTKQKLLSSFQDGTKWDDWQERLARNSLSERLKLVEAAVNQLKTHHQQHGV
ncbi:Alpha/Beta hydrolase protein [Phascolomyces articulosus]|uniref:Alpha/Beta hydrolase protein n=1 Tax=Phascolomyces articulosus TaxID=60185 RepID=A0AAD5K5U6_9FUNG|nr:Alpha/Beta hydrolase protein [Phascolomyces articulosus]